VQPYIRLCTFISLWTTELSRQGLDPNLTKTSNRVARCRSMNHQKPAGIHVRSVRMVPVSNRKMFYSYRKMSKKLRVERSLALSQDLREAWEMVSVKENRIFRATWDSLPIAVWLKISHFPQIYSIPSFRLRFFSCNEILQKIAELISYRWLYQLE